MKMYFDGVLKLVSDESFIGRDGTEVSYYKHIFQCEDEKGVKGIVELSGKGDFGHFIDEEVVVTVGVEKDFSGKGYRIKLLDVKSVTAKGALSKTEVE